MAVAAEKERGCNLDAQVGNGGGLSRDSADSTNEGVAAGNNECNVDPGPELISKTDNSAGQGVNAAESLLMDEAAQLQDLTIIDEDEKIAVKQEHKQIEKRGNHGTKSNLSDGNKSTSPDKTAKSEPPNEGNHINNNSKAFSPSTSTESHNPLPPKRPEPANKESEVKDSSAAASIIQTTAVSEELHPLAKATETDSLILTADDELETEMAMTDKNDKTSEEKSPLDNSICTTAETPQQEHQSLYDTSAFKSGATTLKNNNVKSFEAKASESTNNASASSSTSSPVENECPKDSNTKVNASSKHHSISVGNKSGTSSKRCNASSDSKKPNQSRIVWMSNIDRSVKATDLKQFASQIGSVVAAKVVTDGKNCYGYLVMDSVETATQCVKKLNNEHFDGKKIGVFFTKPTRTQQQENQQSSVVKTGTEVSKEKPKQRIKRSHSSHQEDIRPIKKESSTTSSSRRNKIRRLSVDPLTTRFDSSRSSRERSRSSKRRRSFSNDRYMREKVEQERLRRQISEEKRRNRDLIRRQIEREEEQRELVFRLRQEQKKLKLDREFFERERSELNRLDAERRKIEKERLEILQQRAKLAEELEKSRLKTKMELEKVEKQKYEQSKSPPEPPSNTIRTSKSEKEASSQSKRSTESFVHHKSYDRQIPPPPKINDFDLRKNIEYSKRRYEYEDGGSKSNCGDGRKLEREYQKIEVIDRKFYNSNLGRSAGESTKHEQRGTVRKVASSFDERKGNSFVNRNYAAGNAREVKRFKGEHYLDHREQRNQWQPSVNSNEGWKMGFSNSAPPGSSMARFQVNSFSATYGMPNNRANNSGYHHPPSNVQEYHRYGGLPSITGRKY